MKSEERRPEDNPICESQTQTQNIHKPGLHHTPH